MHSYLCGRDRQIALIRRVLVTVEREWAGTSRPNFPRKQFPNERSPNRSILRVYGQSADAEHCSTVPKLLLTGECTRPRGTEVSGLEAERLLRWLSFDYTTIGPALCVEFVIVVSFSHPT